MEKARIGIIGVGWWGTVGHLEPLMHDPKADLVAVWSRTEEKVRQRAEQYGVPRYYTDYRQMIEECELHGVIVASTPNMHYEQARYALESGLHVLMEKPFVLKAEQANALERIAQARGLLLTVCHPALYQPAMGKAREVIRQGGLGDILVISAIHAQRVYDLYSGDVAASFDERPEGTPRPNPGSYSDPAIVGGGQGHTQASHIIGAILWLTQLQPSTVFAYMDNLGLAVDVVDALAIRFTTGALATVTANGLLPPGVGARQVQIQGDRGILSIDSLRGSLCVFADGEEGPHKIDAPAPPGHDARAAVPRNFLRAILGEEALHVETEVAINEARILHAAYRSAESGQEAKIQR